MEGQELTEDEIKAGLRKRTLANEIVLATCGSAFKNKGVQAVLDAVVEYLPSPDRSKPITGDPRDKDETEAERPSSDDAPICCIAFKIATDPFVGTLTFFRVYSGVVNTGDAFITQLKVSASVLVVLCKCMPIIEKKLKKSVLAILLLRLD